MTDTTAAPPAITAASIVSIGENILQGITDHEGLINTIAGLAGIGPEVSMAEKLLPLLITVLQFLEQETGKGLVQVVEDLISHVTPGQSGAPALAEVPQAS